MTSVAEFSRLLSDIEELFNKGGELPPELLASFCNDLGALVKSRFESYANQPQNYLRMSSIGKPERKVYLDLKDPEPEVLDAQTKLKFLYGDIIELLVLFLAEASGHTVTDKQKQVEIDGIKGSLDALIDGEVVDIKSVSGFSAKKFASEEALRADDPFGYVDQISGYAKACGKDTGWIISVNKENGQISATEIRCNNVQGRIARHKQNLASDQLPPRCYDPQPDGKSGNMKLPIGCVYCRHKFKCWPEVRVFEYANGPAYLTHVVNTPRVPELKR